MARQLGATEQQAQYRTVNFATPVLQDVKLTIHERFSDRPIDLYGQVVAHAGIRRTDAVGDVGCGTGGFLGYLAARGHTGHLVGLDVAHGVFRLAARQLRAARFAAADAVALPLGEGVLDVCCLQHMLSYVPDMAASCREAARVVRVGGTVVATANSVASYPHAVGYRQRAAELFGWPAIEVNTGRFCLENMGDVLGAVFGDVHVAALSGHLRVPAGEYLRWFEQMTFNWNPLPSNAERRELLARLETDWLPAHVDRDGCIGEDKRVGVAWCRLRSKAAGR